MPHEQLCQLFDYFTPGELENSPDLLYLQAIICDGHVEKIIQSYNSLYQLNVICRQRSTSVRLAIDCHVALALHCQRQNDYPSMVCYLRQGVMWLPDNNLVPTKVVPSCAAPTDLNARQLNLGLEATLSLQEYYKQNDNQRGCFDTALLQAWFLMGLGDYGDADIQLQLLNNCYTQYQLCDQAICELYQTTARLHWLQGNLDQAASLLFACRLKAVNMKDHALQHRTQLLLADLYRDQGRLEDANRWYKATSGRSKRAT